MSCRCEHDKLMNLKRMSDLAQRMANVVGVKYVVYKVGGCRYDYMTKEEADKNKMSYEFETV